MKNALVVLLLVSVIALPLSGCIDSVKMDQNGTVTIDPAKSTTNTVTVVTNETEVPVQESNVTKDNEINLQPREEISPVSEEVNKSNDVVEPIENATEDETPENVTPEENDTEEIIPENVTPVDEAVAEATQNVTEEATEGGNATENTTV